MSVVILRGDAASLPLPDASVDLICTSPPYWGKRDYLDQGKSMPGQIGAEETPAEYVAALLACTREWTRVLKPAGSLFVNLDDSYAARADASAGRTWREDRAEALPPVRNTTGFVRRKSLLNLPHRYAIRCTDELDLIQRAGIVWSKPSSMPESVRDRVQATHEYVFHFTKRERYFEAVDEIRRPLAAPRRKAGRSAFGARNISIARTSTGAYDGQNPLGAVPGSVWEIATEPLSVPEHLGTDHHAAYPTALVRRIILGWSPSGICTRCGEGRRPVAHRDRVDIRPGYSKTHNGQALGIPQPGGTKWKTKGKTDVTITGYACACPDASAPTRPAVIADPFGGTGTTSLVADMLGRTGVTIDRSMDYARIAAWRTADPGERARALGVSKPPPVPEGQGSLFDDREVS